MFLKLQNKSELFFHFYIDTFEKYQGIFFHFYI